MSTVDVVVGAAFGSEGKGHITAQLVKRRLADKRDVLNVRVAGPNAGHTVIDDEGRSFALRAVPVGAVYEQVALYIAPGSEVDMVVLRKELNELREAGHEPRLFVSGEATLLEGVYIEQEKFSDLTERAGSTSKGIGAARSARIWRKAKRVMDDEGTMTELAEFGVKVVDLDGTSFIHRWAESPTGSIVIEGTQGYGLGLHAGFYPQSTSSDCRAVDFLAMAGLSPWHIGVARVSVWLVARVFPIRVAGNSGPLAGETTWDALNLPDEHTTVTKKVRRVGAWDSALVEKAVRANGGGQANPRVAVRIALTMVDQKFPSLAGVANLGGWIKSAPIDEVQGSSEFIREVERDCAAKVGLIATSPNTVVWLAQAI